MKVGGRKQVSGWMRGEMNERASERASGWVSEWVSELCGYIDQQQKQEKHKHMTNRRKTKPNFKNNQKQKFIFCIKKK